MSARDALPHTQNSVLTSDLGASESRESRWIQEIAESVVSPERKTVGAGESLPVPGSVVANRFVIERELGRGGMGVVFAARDERMGGRPVALKWLHMGSQMAHLATARLLREAVAAIDHPNVVCIYEIDVERPFLVMELLQGMSLAARLRSGPFSIEEACQVMLQTMDGMAAVHDRELIHRDLKPENIFLARGAGGRLIPKILDFGLVKWSRATPAHWTMTAEGTVMGTPAYMAPEQASGGLVDVRTDLYALSVVFYEMVTGRRPFSGATPLQLGARILAGGARAPRELRGDLPVGVERVILKGMSVKPEGRYRDVRGMAAALRGAMREGAAVDGKRVRRNRLIALAAVAGMGLGSLVALGVAGRRDERAVMPPALPIVAVKEVRVAPVPEPLVSRPPERAAERETESMSARRVEEAVERKLEDFVEEFDRLVVPAGE